MFLVLYLLATTVVLSASIIIAGLCTRRSNKGTGKTKIFVNPFDDENPFAGGE
jgi:hypothetical protein